MKRYCVIVAMAGAVMLAACKDSTSPDTGGPYVVGIVDIHMPDQVAPGDTVRLDFLYGAGGCDSAVLQIRQGESELHFTATAYPTERFCLQTFGPGQRFYYTVMPPHYAPLVVKFTEPNRGDSVRVVSVEEQTS